MEKMTPKQPRETPNQADLLRPRLDNITNTGHPLLKLAHNTDWMFFERGSGALDVGKVGLPRLPIRLPAALHHPGRTLQECQRTPCR